MWGGVGMVCVNVGVGGRGVDDGLEACLILFKGTLEAHRAPRPIMSPLTRSEGKMCRVESRCARHWGAWIGGFGIWTRVYGRRRHVVIVMVMWEQPSASERERWPTDEAEAEA